MDEIRGRAVEDDDLDREAESPLDFSLDVPGDALEGRSWSLSKQDGDVHVARRSRRAASATAVEIRREHIARGAVENGLDLWGNGWSRHPTIIGRGSGRGGKIERALPRGALQMLGEMVEDVAGNGLVRVQVEGHRGAVFQRAGADHGP